MVEQPEVDENGMVVPGVWWTVLECQVYAGYLSDSSIYSAISAGRLHAWKRGPGLNMIDSNHFKNWLASLSPKGFKRGKPRPHRRGRPRNEKGTKQREVGA